MAARLKSPLCYPGSKPRVANTICRLGHANGYKAKRVVDVFIGGGSLLLRFAEDRPGVALVANDFDPAVAALWRCMVDSATAEKLCSQLPDTVTTQDAQDALAIIEGKAPDDVTLAAALIVRTRTSFRGIPLRRAGILGGLDGNARCKVDSRYKAKTIRERIRNITAAVAGRVTVYQDDFETVIRKYDGPDTLLLLDPPYVDLGDDLYPTSLTPADHERLAACLRGLEHATWVMTNGMDPLTYNLYDDGKHVMLPLRVEGAQGSRLERAIVPRQSPLARSALVSLPPMAPSQFGADVLAVGELGPEVVMSAGTKRSKKPAKRKKPRAGKPKVPAVKPLTDKERKLLAGREESIRVNICFMFSSFVRVGNDLRYINKARLYRESHRTFAEYCDDRWHISRGRAYQLMRAAEAVEAIQLEFFPGTFRPLASGIEEGLVPANEAQARSLVPLLNNTRTGTKALCTVWQRVLDRTAAGEALTDGLVAEEVSKWKTEHGQAPPERWDYTEHPLGDLHTFETRIGKLADRQSLDNAMEQLRKLMQVLEQKQKELASAPPPKPTPE